jgi:hypothetical protein
MFRRPWMLRTMTTSSRVSLLSDKVLADDEMP